MLISLEARYQGDKDVLTARLRGADGQTMTSEERLAEFVLLVREYLRGKHEHKFESCAPAVGMAETPQARVDRYNHLCLEFKSELVIPCYSGQIDDLSGSFFFNLC